MIKPTWSQGEMPAPPAPEVLAELRGYEVAWISDAMGLNLMDREIRPVFPLAERVVGAATTVAVPPGDFLMISAALTQAPEGSVLVIDSRGSSARAVWGEYFSGWAKGLGLEAVVIEGATRDATEIGSLKYPVFARATTPRGPTLNGPGEVNVPVSCGGVAVLPGDIIVGDREGVVVIPRRKLDAVLDQVRATADGERTHHGHPAAGREEYEAYFELAFAARVQSGQRLRQVEATDGSGGGK